MFERDAPTAARSMAFGPVEVDTYGLPIDAFGSQPPPHFFEVIGRILAVNAQIEYLQDRLDHLPPHETIGVRKVEQFKSRCAAERDERNAVVHSRWVFRVDVANEGTFVGVRYKKRKRASQSTVTVSLTDVTDSQQGQEMVEHTIESLRAILRKNITTMRIGHHAYTEVMIAWAKMQVDAGGGLTPDT